MQIKLGDKIRELRRLAGRTQEDLACALGVTSQAISRWESGGGYPDMETIPAIANYFGVTIDELFGYENDREKKIDAIIQRIESFSIKSDGDDGWVDECLAILREGLAEFPGNERLLITLAETLWEAGWRRHDYNIDRYDEEGFIQYAYDKERKNKYWSEACRICENLIESGAKNDIFVRAVAVIVPLYRNYGDYERAIAYAKRMPDMKKSREFLLTEATDGKRNAAYNGEFLLLTAKAFANQLVDALIADKHNFESDMPIRKIKGAIDLFCLICDDGNLGAYHGVVIQLYLYLSCRQWERGYHDDAFRSLDESLKHAKALDAFNDGKEHTLTAPLVSLVTQKSVAGAKCANTLPDDWPFWCNPDYSKVAKEIRADPRWKEWVKRTQA